MKAGSAAAKPFSIDRIKTGIAGFDAMIPEGIPRGSTIQLTGGPGSGKTIFGLQFLVEGARRFSEPGLYVSFEESEESLKQTAMLFGWDAEGLEKKKMLDITSRNVFDVKSFAESMQGQFKEAVQAQKVKRVVFDSITSFVASSESAVRLRKEITGLCKRLKQLGITTIFIAERPDVQSPLMPVHDFAVEEFLVDGVVYLHNLFVRDTRQRAVEVLKMRKTAHDTFVRPFKIVPGEGIRVFNKELVFTEG
ncbi:AAA family ATPase [Candidatus Micrarchaeota archaeon]|nr:AAA family ATPase [Candidatus Micrarchaeota archaeon]